MIFSDIISGTALAYSENVPLRLILTTAFPIGGSIIDVALSSYASKIYEKRIEESLQILKKETDGLNQQLLDKEFLRDEAFFDMFRLYLEKSLRTRQEMKIQYYARLLTEGIKNPITVEQIEQDIEKISSLTVQDLLVMHHMYEDNLRDHELFGNPDEFIQGTTFMKKIPSNLPEIEGMNKSEIEISIYNLISTGLVREFVGTAAEYRGGWYFITPLLKEIMKKLFRKELAKL